MSKIYLSVVIPAYNEAERLPLAILSAENYLSQQSYPWEMIVVDDGSTDGTSDFVERFHSTKKQIKLIRNDANAGKGAAVKKGMLVAAGKYRFFMDADNSAKIENIESLLPFLESDADAVIGSRYLKDSKFEKTSPWHRWILSREGSYVIRKVLFLGVKDTQCGFKGFRGEAAEKIFGLSRINGCGFHVEILALLRHFGYRVKELPVAWKNQPSSHGKPYDYLRVLGDAVKIRWWLKRGIYSASKSI